MSFGYTHIKTEALAYGTRVFSGYDTVHLPMANYGVVLSVRLFNEPVTGPHVKDQELFLPFDTVAGLAFGMSGSPFVQLLAENLGQGAVRYVRAYQTPAGSVLFHRYTMITAQLAGRTVNMVTDEFFMVILSASISGTDIVTT